MYNTNVLKEWWLQMVFTNGACIKMVYTNGVYKWCIQMVYTNGEYKW